MYYKKQPFSLTILLLVLGTTFFYSCEDVKKEQEEMQLYEGPLRQIDSVKMYYSESTIKKVILNAVALLEYSNGDREFPKGIYIEFFEPDGGLSSTLKSNEAYFDKEKNLWKATGDVVVKSIVQNQQLNSEELFWKPDTEKIYTEKFVTIRMENEVIYGSGFESTQDFREYTIKNPKGEFDLDN